MNATQALRCMFCSAALVAASLSAAACDQSDAHADPAPPAAQVAESEPSSAQPSDKQASSDEQELSGEQAYDEQAFALEIHGPDTAKVGEPVQLSILLAAKNGFKVNEEYPAKFTFVATEGVRPQSLVVKKDDAKLSKEQCEMPAQVTLTSPGKHRVGGKMSFSVCTDDRCLIEKRELVLEIEAS